MTTHVQQERLHTNWQSHLKDEEKQRLEILQGRIDRKTLVLRDIVQERQRLMARAIRRMRRGAGKT